MNDDLNIDVGNKILIFKYKCLLFNKSEQRNIIIEQLKDGVVVIDESVEVIVVDKGDSKQ